jgi:hypothetical protein
MVLLMGGRVDYEWVLDSFDEKRLSELYNSYASWSICTLEEETVGVAVSI